MTNIIDPHVHLFDMETGQYHWLADGVAPFWDDKYKIAHSFLEQDLQLPQSMNLTGFVHIEAGFDNDHPWRELEWLESHCALPFKSVAFLDLMADSAADDLDRLCEYKSLVGIRYILDDDAKTLLTNSQFQENLALLAQRGLLFEAQYSIEDESATQAMLAVLKNTPGLKVVINHAGLPSGNTLQWQEAIRALAHFEQCSVKCSGWEMADRQWQIDEVKPIIDYVIREFGLVRVMLASNFPVSELSHNYAALWERLAVEMNWRVFEQSMLLEENARRIYGF